MGKTARLKFRMQEVSPTIIRIFTRFNGGSVVVDIALSRIPSVLRKDVLDILTESKSSYPQKRARMLQKGLLRSVADELEVLSETGT